MRNLTASVVVPAVLVFGANVVSAVTVTVYTDKAAWADALGRQFGIEAFADDQLDAGVSFESTESGHINPSLKCYQDVLASESQNEPMTTWHFAAQITGYGGNWTLGGPGGSGNSLLLYIDDFSLYVGAIPNSYSGGFWGFVCDTQFTSVRLVGGGGLHQQNYRLDDMMYGPVPSKADFDADGDVDADDLGIFAACATGPAMPYAPDTLPGTAPGCSLTPDVNGRIAPDFDEDGDVDQADFAVLQRCFAGPDTPPDADCAA